MRIQGFWREFPHSTLSALDTANTRVNASAIWPNLQLLITCVWQAGQQISTLREESARQRLG